MHAVWNAPVRLSAGSKKRVVDPRESLTGKKQISLRSASFKISALRACHVLTGFLEKEQKKRQSNEKLYTNPTIFSTIYFIFINAFFFKGILEGGKELSTHQHVSVEDADFMFENKLVKVIANRNEGKIVLAGLEVGPFEEGREYEIRFWVACELEKVGIVRFREEDLLDVVKLHKIHWRERVQPTNKVSPLFEEFYPQLRRYLTYLRKAANNNSEKLKEQEKSARISRDIVNCRVKKIVSLASSPSLSSQALQSLTPEEKAFYYQIHKSIDEWRSKILQDRDVQND